MLWAKYDRYYPDWLRQLIYFPKVAYVTGLPEALASICALENRLHLHW